MRFNRVAVNFFSAFEVPILAGRGFESGDTAPASPGEPPQGGMVVVNRSLAQRVFGGNALGKHIRYVDSRQALRRRTRQPGRWYEIAGIVSDFPTGVSAGMDDSDFKVYHAVAAGQVQPAVTALRIRSGSPAIFSQRLREIAASVDPELHLRDIRSLEEALRRNNGSAAWKPGCSWRSRPASCCCHRRAFTLSCRSPCRNAAAKSGYAWRSAPAGGASSPPSSLGH